MDRTKIVAEINNTLAEQFELPEEVLKAESSLKDDLQLDSLDAVDMLVHLEDQVGVKLDVEKLQTARTLGDIYTLVEELVAAN